MQIKSNQIQILLLFCMCVATRQTEAQFHKRQKIDNVLAELQVVCRSDSIVLKVNTKTPFNGMVYAKDAPNSANCVSEYNSSTNMTFMLPLKSCGTMFAEADDGIEYFNTVIVQPHMRLMTNQGKGYHIRCKYQTRERTIANTHFNVSASFLMQNNPQASTTPLLATASMPSCTMKIFRSGRDDVAETVKIGDKLIMVIEIDQQDMYGMRITNCVVRDGMNMAEQQLINDLGCPVDETIMPKFAYTNNSTRAAVSFPAHKFPHTSSIYYQCNVHLCINNGGCDPIECNQTTSAPNNNGLRSKRSTQGNQLDLRRLASPVANSLQSFDAQPALSETGPMSFDVYSGLHVSDFEIGESSSSDGSVKQVAPKTEQMMRNNPSGGQKNFNDVCLNFDQTGLRIVLFGLAVLCVAVLLMCQLGLITKPSATRSHRSKIGSSLRLPA